MNVGPSIKLVSHFLRVLSFVEVPFSKSETVDKISMRVGIASGCRVLSQLLIRM